MARQSYLSRVAQPLAHGDPVIASIPRAAPEESRQAISPAARPLASLQRPSSSGAIMQPADSWAAPKGPSGEPASGPVNDVPAPPAAVEQSSRSLPMTRSPASAEKASSILGCEGAARPAPKPPLSPALAAPSPAAPSPFRRTETVQAASAPKTEQSNVRFVAPPVHLEEAGVLPAPFISPAKPHPPRLHIGAIEVRVAQPQPPNPAPAPPIVPVTGPIGPTHNAPAPISTSYASRFGLAQG